MKDIMKTIKSRLKRKENGVKQEYNKQLGEITQKGNGRFSENMKMI